MNKIKWYFKQIIPLKFKSTYWENGKKYYTEWRMFFGKCFNITTIDVAKEIVIKA